MAPPNDSPRQHVEAVNQNADVKESNVPCRVSTVKWTSLMDGNKDAVLTIQGNLHHRGWCLVEWPEELVSNASTLHESVKRLRWGGPHQVFRHPLHLGFIERDQKEGYRYLTGDHLELDTKWIPSTQGFDVNLKGLTKWLDEAQVEFVDKLGPELFDGQSPSDIASRSLAPLLRDLSNDMSKTETPHKYGLFDYVEYHPDAEWDNDAKRYRLKGGQPTTAVAAHVDPGLFAFSVFSSAPGLEVYDPIEGAWFQVPTDTGIIWCGSAAGEVSNGFLTPCNHRVVLHEATERATMWQELAVPGQLPDSVHTDGLRGTGELPAIASNSGKVYGDEFTIAVLLDTGERVDRDARISTHYEGDERVLEYVHAVCEQTKIVNDKRSRTGKALKISVRPDWSLLDVLFAVENTWNLPFAKMSPTVYYKTKRLVSRDPTTCLRDIGIQDGEMLTYGYRPNPATLKLTDEEGQDKASPNKCTLT